MTSGDVNVVIVRVLRRRYAIGDVLWCRWWVRICMSLPISHPTVSISIIASVLPLVKSVDIFMLYAIVQCYNLIQ